MPTQGEFIDKHPNKSERSSSLGSRQDVPTRTHSADTTVQKSQKEGVDSAQDLTDENYNNRMDLDDRNSLGQRSSSPKPGDDLDIPTLGANISGIKGEIPRQSQRHSIEG